MALDSGTYRPDPATYDPDNTNVDNPFGQFENGSAAPGAFGARVEVTIGSIGVLTTTAAYMNVYDVAFDTVSPTLQVDGGAFLATSLDVGALAGAIALDGVTSSLLSGQVIPDALRPFPTFLAPNGAAAGTIADLGGVHRQLTLPISVPFTLDLGYEAVFNGTMTGQIVAYAQVPEPSAIVLAAVALPLVVLLRRRVIPARSADATG